MPVNVFESVPIPSQKENVFESVTPRPDFGTEQVFLPDGNSINVPMFSSDPEIRRIILQEAQKKINLYGDFEVDPVPKIDPRFMGAGERKETKLGAGLKGFGAFVVGLPTPVLGIPLEAIGAEIETTREKRRVALRKVDGKVVRVDEVVADTSIFEQIKVQLRKTSIPDIFKDNGKGIIEANQRFLFELGLFPKDRENEFAFMIGGAFGSSASAVGGLLVTRNPRAAAVFFGGLQASFVYKELAETIGHQDAATKALFAGIFEAAAEAYGAHTFLEIAMKPGTALGKGLKSGAVEFIQEATQSGGESAILFDFRDDDIETILKHMIVSGAVGAIVGTSAGLSIGAIQNIMEDRRPDLAEYIKEHPEVAEALDEKLASIIGDAEIGLDELLESVGAATMLEISESSATNMKPETKAKILDVLEKFLNFEDIVTPEDQAKQETALIQKTINAAKRIQETTEAGILRGRIARLEEDVAQIDRDTTQVKKDIGAAQEELFLAREDNSEKSAVVKRAAKKEAALEEKRIDLAFRRQELGGELRRAKSEGRALLTDEDIGADKVTLKETTEKARATKALKEALRIVRSGLAKGRVLQKRETKAIQNAIIGVIQASPLSQAERAAFLKTIKNIQAPEQFEAQLPKILARIENKVRKRLARESMNTLKKLIKDTAKPAKGGVKARSRLGAEVRELFEMLNKILGVTGANKDLVRQKLIDRQEDLLGEIVTEGTVTMKDVSESDRLELRLIEILLNESDTDKSNDAVDVADFVDELLAVKGEGIAGRKREEEQRKKEQDSLADAIFANNALADPDTVTDNDLKDTVIQLAKAALSYVISDWNVIRTRLRLDQDDRFSLTREESKHRGDMLRWELAMKKLVDGVFGFKNDKEMTDKMLKDTSTADEDMVINQEYEASGNIDELIEEAKSEIASGERALAEAKQKGKGTKRIEARIKKNKKLLAELEAFTPKKIRIKLNRSQLRKRWMELMDPRQRALIMNPKGMGYTEGIIADIQAALTQQDLLLIEGQLKIYSLMYEELNEVYKVEMGRNLPKNEFYSKIIRRGSEDTILDEANFRIGVSFSSLKTRVDSTSKLVDLNDLDTLQRYLYEASHYVAFAKKIRNLDAVFVANKDVRASIGNTMGLSFLKHIDDKLAKFANNGNEMGGAVQKILNVVRRNFAIAVLGLKVQIGLKQTVSIFAMFEKIPVADILPGIQDFLSNPKAAMDILKQDPFIASRGQKGLNSVEVEDALTSRKFDIFREKPTLRNLLLLPLRTGDIMPVYMGGWVMYKSLLKKGVSPEEALLRTSAHAEQTQQSTLITNTTPAQDHPIGRLFVMFSSSPTALAKMEVIAFIKLLQKREGSRKELARAILIYHFLIPMLFQFVADLFRPTREQYRAMILGPFNGIAILGDVLESAVGAAIGTKSYRYNVFAFDLLDDLMGLASDLGQEDLDFGDWVVDTVELAGTLAGLPIETGFNITEGLKGIPDKNVPISESAARLFGWPPSVIEAAKD